MYTLDKIKLNIVKLTNKALAPLDNKTGGVKAVKQGGHLAGRGRKLVQVPTSRKAGVGIPTASVGTSDLILPPKPEFGDLSLPCFELAKNLNKTAVETAEWLVSEIEVDDVVVAVKAIGPYLNFTFNKIYLAKNAIESIKKEKGNYGRNKSGKGKRVMIEYSNVNTHKEYHVGHLRNICYGDSVSRVLSANGYKTIPVSYINDFGIHVAKTLWCYQEFYKDIKLPKNKPSSASADAEALADKKATCLPAGTAAGKGYFLGKIYVRACEELEKNSMAKELVAFLMRKIESRKGAEFKLWQKTRKWSIEQFNKIYKELNVKFDHIFYESEFIDKGRDMVAKLYEKHFLEKSQGAIIANLEKYDLGVLLFLRSDNTALYPVADLPLAIEKFKKYKLDKSIYVVDVRQSLYFKQLFKVFELLGHTSATLSTGKEELVHLGHEFVKLPEGMMSSRKGQVITYEDLREQAIKKAEKETKKRHKSWANKKIEQVAVRIVNGAIKFEMIKVGAGQTITFDINQALRFDGFTAAYLQYTYARINSISKKSGNLKLDPAMLCGTKFDKLIDHKEHGLVLKLAKYPDVVVKAGENYDPSKIAKYLFDLAQLFNDYYHSVPVLKSKKETRYARLALISAVSQVIANGLDLLGIETVEEM